MKNHTFGTTAAVVSLLATASVAAGGSAGGDATRRSAPVAFASSAPSRFHGGSTGDHRISRTGIRRRLEGVIAWSSPAAAAAAAARCCGSGSGEAAALMDSEANRPRRKGPRRRRRRWRQRSQGLGGGRHQTRCFPWTEGVSGEALAATAAPGGSFAEAAEAGETTVERCIRRLDVAVRRVFADYYSCTDVRETTGSLGVFLEEAAAALDLEDPSTSSSPSSSPPGAWPTHIVSLLKARLLESSERLNYHLDGDQPMVLYRLWIRGRAIDVYERDLLHCPRWIELVAETKRQMDDSPVVVEGRMGTVCYPSGDIFEGQVDSLLRFAKAGETPPADSAAFPAAKNQNAFFDAEMASSETSAASRHSEDKISGGGSGGIIDQGVVAADVRAISGLVSLTLDCLEDGLSDETAIMQRHFRSPDFGHPLLRLASPSDNDPDHPHIPDDPEMNPALLRAEQELTEEHLVQGERRAKELMHDRRRAQLDVYLICAAYRKYKPPAATPGGGDTSSEGGWNLHEEDTQILDRLLREAAAIESPS